MTQAPASLDEILYAFAEDGMDDATLAEYIRRYPEFAGELIDLAHELRAVEADIEAPYTPDTAWESKAWVRFAKAIGVTPADVNVADPFASMSSARQVEIRRELDVPVSVFNAFRDRQVEAQSVPRPFLSRFAAYLSVRHEQLVALLTLPARLDPAMQFKADDRPSSESGKISFGDLLDEAMVPAPRRAELMREE